MWTPRDERDEYKMLRRYGNDYSRMPARIREFYRLTLKRRHHALVRNTGNCWSMPIDGGQSCPLCNTGTVLEPSQSSLPLAIDNIGTKTKLFLKNGNRYE